MDRPRLIVAGDQRALASLIRDLDDGRPEAAGELRGLTDGRSPPFVVGITGPAGAGKSTLLDGLIARLRTRGERVGVVAVDPSSARAAGGAVLGDRVRMQRHATDSGVFIRSLATRGARGGLSAAAADVLAALGAGGYGTVLLETVGVGQAEVDVAAAADVVVVVAVPGLGDEVQALKAGLLEIADVVVVNKGDRADADRTIADMAAMLDIRRAAATTRTSGGAADEAAGSAAAVPIVRTVATTGEGLDELWAAVERARGAAPAMSLARRRQRAVLRIEQAVTARAAAQVRTALAPDGRDATLADEVAAGRLDAGAAADVLMSRLGRGY
jgi:LAO/AO transport system kinase